MHSEQYTTAQFGNQTSRLHPSSMQEGFCKNPVTREDIDNQQLKSKGGPGEAVIFANTGLYGWIVCQVYLLNLLTFQILGDLVESFVMDLKSTGLYRSWPFQLTKLVVDRPSMP